MHFPTKEPAYRAPACWDGHMGRKNSVAVAGSRWTAGGAAIAGSVVTAGGAAIAGTAAAPGAWPACDAVTVPGASGATTARDCETPADSATCTCNRRWEGLQTWPS